jgi:hypothetical protein
MVEESVSETLVYLNNMAGRLSDRSDDFIQHDEPNGDEEHAET